ncbi:hypothetical protein QVD17_08607 [Tagetes erecta]|uniref:Uncharacterized protein n=1 Tax=Tagetes erecta TaxID=13708 RepID=A0AAD8L4N0_TARER|nr:hypothetical protein QVD17_08607 [Tagetes erecta]
MSDSSDDDGDNDNGDVGENENVDDDDHVDDENFEVNNDTVEISKEVISENAPIEEVIIENAPIEEVNIDENVAIEEGNVMTEFDDRLYFDTSNLDEDIEAARAVVQVECKAHSDNEAKTETIQISSPAVPNPNASGDTEFAKSSDAEVIRTSTEAEVIKESSLEITKVVDVVDLDKDEGQSKVE